jgi:hypothetical protein
MSTPRLIQASPRLRASAQILGTAVFLLTSTPVLADTTTLVCDTGNSNNGPVTLGIDKDAGTVTLTFSPMRNLPQIPVRPSATMKAEFDANAIRFSESPDGRSMNYSINRSTGIVNVTEINGGQAFHYSWTCQVNKPQF